MKVTKLKPQGYCKGVILALNKCFEAINDPNLKKPLFMLGMPINNQKVTNALKAKGLIILEGKSRLEMLDDIKEGTVIFSAHGVSKKVVDKAKDKGLAIIDTTCENVKKIQEALRKTHKHILYLGINNHPESEAVINEFPNLTLITNPTDLTKLDFTKEYFATNQSTMSIYDTKAFYTNLKSKLKNLEVIDLVCDATTLRQKALFNQKADLIVIVGDKHSSNTQKLYEIALTKTQHQYVIKVEDLNDFQGLDLKNYANAIVTSGASTPKLVTKEIIDYLENYPNKKAISSLQTDDYLEF